MGSRFDREKVRCAAGSASSAADSAAISLSPPNAESGADEGRPLFSLREGEAGIDVMQMQSLLDPSFLCVCVACCAALSLGKWCSGVLLWCAGPLIPRLARIVAIEGRRHAIFVKIVEDKSGDNQPQLVQILQESERTPG